MKEKLISIEDIRKVHSVFRKSYGDRLARIAMKLAGLHNVNRVYDAGKHKTGTDVEDAMLDCVGIQRQVHHADLLKQMGDQPFITISNHPYGHIDGIMLVGEVAKIRPDFKVMVNWMLGMIDTMQDHFIGVNPYDSGSLANRSSLSGVKECIRHLKQGHPLGFFPAGAISHNKINRIEDREWQASVIKLIQKAGVPVIPIFISGRNSHFFNFLGLIDWRLRTVRLCHELANKKGKPVHMVIGKAISPEELKQHPDIKDLGEFLKQETYKLKKEVR